MADPEKCNGKHIIELFLPSMYSKFLHSYERQALHTIWDNEF
jgi:hypothetical protein